MIRQLHNLEAELYSDAEYRKGRKVTSERLEFTDWWKEQRSAARVRSAATVIKNDGDLDVVPAIFDAEPMLLNAPNGIIDLYSGELLDHDPALMLRRQIPVEYNPKAKAPQWEAFLERVMPSADMRDYLQRIVGYTLTGETSEQVVFFHVGPPATGKSVFLRVMSAVLGEFSRVVPTSTLLSKRIEQHPTDVMGMEGRRMLQASETPEGARLDEALVKRLSGEEVITARGMGENFRDFSLVGKVHLATNHPPSLSDDPAVHRRLHLVPWQVEIPEDERDPLLGKKLIRWELPGILAWAVRGSRRWTEQRLARPVEAQLAKTDYVTREDDFGLFIEDELILGAENAFTESKLVYRRYRQWAEGQGMTPMSAVAFGRRMSARGVEPARTNSNRGFRCHLSGLSIAPDPLGD
jgi:putative DNA primase/helicase